MKSQQREDRRRWDGRGLGLAVALSLAGCGGEDTGPSQPPPLVVFSSEVTRVEIEVDYALGAEPYLDSLEFVGNPFSLTRENLTALFAGSAKEVVVPMDYSFMEVIEAPPGPYDGSDIVAIAANHRSRLSTGDAATYYAVWLNGFYQKNGKTDEAVLGAALPDYGIVAMFKPAVRKLEHPALRSLSRFTEQSAFVHEMGHVLGLVDTGIPQVVPHEDAAHDGHCSNPDCVMYWANEGAETLRRFAAQFATSGSDVLFDANCLADAMAAGSR